MFYDLKVITYLIRFYGKKYTSYSKEIYEVFSFQKVDTTSIFLKIDSKSFTYAVSELLLLLSRLLEQNGFNL